MNRSIIFLKNLDPSNGPCNRTKIMYKSFEENIIYAENNNRITCWKISYISLSFRKNKGHIFYFKKK